MSTEAPIHLTPYAGEETVSVRAQPIAIDPRSSAKTTVLPPEFLENIPLYLPVSKELSKRAPPYWRG